MYCQYTCNLDELVILVSVKVKDIEKQFGLLSGNKAQLDPCPFIAKDHYLRWNQASTVIIHKFICS